jgi:hypothetical protein
MWENGVSSEALEMQRHFGSLGLPNEPSDEDHEVDPTTGEGHHVVMRLDA